MYGQMKLLKSLAPKTPLCTPSSFRLVLSVQRQEVVGQDAAQAFMPAAGAVAGGIFGGALYPVTGAVAGAGFGLSAANAFGEVVAKCELSAAMPGPDGN
eukprot:g16578.t1